MGLLLNTDIDFDIIALSQIGHVNCENVAHLPKHPHKFDSIIEKDDNVSSFFNMMLSNIYIPHITLPTCITDHSIFLIDHILLKESNMICNKITAGNIYNNITDHLPNFIFIEMHRKNSQQIGERPMTRLYSDINISAFKTLLSRC